MYLYNAGALALGGGIVRSTQHVVESQATCSLPTSGGTAASRIEKFSLNGLVSFDLAQSDLSGGVETKNGKEINVTRVSVVIEGLKIRDIVMADRIVVGLTTEHGPDDEEPSIITTGCGYEGLRIAGHVAVVKTAHDLFSEMPTYAHWQDAWKKGGESRMKIANSLIGKSITDPLQPSHPRHLHEVREGCTRQEEADALKQTVLSSFVTNVDGIDGSEIKNWGPIVVVPQFGTIYMGEVFISHGQRRVNMLRLELGSSNGGTFVVASGSVNGTLFPP